MLFGSYFYGKQPSENRDPFSTMEKNGILSFHVGESYSETTRKLIRMNAIKREDLEIKDKLNEYFLKNANIGKSITAFEYKYNEIKDIGFHFDNKSIMSSIFVRLSNTENISNYDIIEKTKKMISKKFGKPIYNSIVKEYQWIFGFCDITIFTQNGDVYIHFCKLF